MFFFKFPSDAQYLSIQNEQCLHHVLTTSGRPYHIFNRPSCPSFFHFLILFSETETKRNRLEEEEMSQVFRRIVGFKINRGHSNRMKEHEHHRNVITLRNKERDKLLQEFLLAREELKAQFDVEKREIIGNYERRVLHLRRLLEEYDENLNMMKLNLDAEKEENFILKTKVLELEGQFKYEKSGKPSMDNIQSGCFNESYDNESPSSKSRNTPLKYHKEKSSVDGLKYSDRIASCGSIQNNSLSSSPFSSLQSTKTGYSESDMHDTCRKEFNRLLNALRTQQDTYDKKMQEERESMKEQLENEKLQLERVVYKQLNMRFEREMKKQELLLTENTHLRTTISNTIMEHMNARDTNTRATSKQIWKENNSDSGADVDDNRSDDDSDMFDSGKCSFTLSDRLIERYFHDHFDKKIISKLLDETHRAYQSANVETPSKRDKNTNRMNKVINHTNIESEQTPHQHLQKYDLCIQDITSFHEEFKCKLKVLQELFTSDQQTLF